MDCCVEAMSSADPNGGVGGFDPTSAAADAAAAAANGTNGTSNGFIEF